MAAEHRVRNAMINSLKQIRGSVRQPGKHRGKELQIRFSSLLQFWKKRRDCTGTRGKGK